MYINEFTFVNETDRTKTTKQFDGVDLNTVLVNFEDFLRGCGFVIDGHIDIVNDDDIQIEGGGLDWTSNEILKTTALFEQTSLDKNNEGL